MPSKKNRDYELTVQLLTEYRDAAIVNARELVAEAGLLLQHGHQARAYFLAVAAIEETGKAVQAFDGMGRNLKDSAVSQRLKIQFGDHSIKINSAFVPWLVASPDIRAEVMSFVNTMIDIGHGRELSMYVDVKPNGGAVSMPGEVVRSIAAENCVRLAKAVLTHATPHVMQIKPKVRTKVQDEFFAFKQAFLKMANTADFWEYYIFRMEAGDKALEVAVTTYHAQFHSKGMLFAPQKYASDGA
jgi:AbiV family abortive infection protein